ncbi:MAG TPA: hypothetical protein VGB20_01655 [bacterium]
MCARATTGEVPVGRLWTVRILHSVKGGESMATRRKKTAKKSAKKSTKRSARAKRR